MRCLVLLFSAARPAAAMLLRGSRVRADPKAPAKARTSAAARTAAIVSSSSVLPRGPRAVPLSAAAVRRQASVAGVIAAATSRQLPGLSVLQSAAVQPSTRKMYIYHIELMNEWRKTEARGAEPKDEESWDVELVEYFDFLFEKGERPGVGEKSLASVMFMHPLSVARDARRFPQARMALRGWRRLEPPVSRVPVPYEIMCMMVVFLYSVHRPAAALAILTIFELYLRPGEAATVRAEQLVAPLSSRVAGRDRWSITLHPNERLEASKVKEFDETLSFDLPRQDFVGPALQALAGLHQDCENIFGMSSKEISGEFRWAASSLGLVAVGIVNIYQLRHGGASHDFNAGVRGISAVRRRGRWASWRSVRRYEKGARTTEVVSRLGPIQRKFAEACVEAVKDVVRGRRVLARPSWAYGSLSRSSLGLAALDGRGLKRASACCSGTRSSGRSTTSAASRTSRG